MRLLIKPIIIVFLFLPFKILGQVVMVEDFHPFANDSNPSEFESLGLFDIFRATLSSDIGPEICITDGTAAGTDTIRNINRNSAGSSDPKGMTAFNGLVWFGAFDGISAAFPNSTGFELYVTDGTYAGTTIFMDIFPGNASSDPEEFCVLGTNMLFNADGGTDGNELWITDGTVGGTTQLIDINPAGDSNPSGFTVVGSELFFAADDGTNGEELWKTDGTLAGTVMVRNINPGAAASAPHDLIEMGGTLYFSATDGTNGRELWESDGTMGGTSMVIDINPSGDGLTDIFAKTPTIGTINSELFFAASTIGLADMELWHSDGTAGGTSLFLVINGSGSALPIGFTNTSSELIFTATDAANGREIWTTDGTLANTMILADIKPGSSGSFPQEYGYNATIDNLYFRAEDSNLIGAEIWKYGPVVLSNELVHFSAIRIFERAQLDWSTATETNSHKFIIEHSLDGTMFQPIGEVNGAGHSTSSLTYQYIDEQPNAGVNYYRLKQVNFDGHFDYSAVKTLYFDRTTAFNVYPNPFSDQLYFELPIQNEQVLVQIHDMFGRLVSQQQLMLEPTVQIRLDDLIKGTYILSVQTSNQRYTEKIVKH